MTNFFNPNAAKTDAYDWYADRYQAVYVSRNRWLLMALMSMTLAALQTVLLLCLVPLKTSVPFLVKEETSGAITTVIRLSGDGSVTYSEAVRKYFLGRYIVQRETYDPADLAQNYQAVDLMSNDSERQIIKDIMSTSNPLSPLNLYGQQTRRLVHLKSIVFLNDHTAQIRFTATEQRAPYVLKTSEWIATVAFRFGAVPARETDRLINPLGFTITHYRIDQEVLP